MNVLDDPPLLKKSNRFIKNIIFFSSKICDSLLNIFSCGQATLQEAYKRLSPSVGPFVGSSVGLSVSTNQTVENERFRSFLCVCVDCWKGSRVGCWVWMGISHPCPPVLNNIVTPHHWFLVADTRLYTLPCWSGRPSIRRSVRPSVRNIFELRSVLALLLLPNRPRLYCRVSGLV